MKISHLLTLCCLGIGFFAHATQTISVKDDTARQLISALKEAGLKLKTHTDQLATIKAKGLACTSHNNTPLDPSDASFAISTQECRVHVPASEGPFSSKGKSVKEAHYVGDAIENAIAYGNEGGWDCAMGGKCAVGVMDISCQIKLSVESEENRFFCDLTTYDVGSGK